MLSKDGQTENSAGTGISISETTKAMDESASTIVNAISSSSDYSELNYNEGIEKREEIINFIRSNSHITEKVSSDLADSILETEINTSILAIAVSFGKNLREKTKKRTIYSNVINSILEKIFDPTCDFKMTKQDIIDTFEAKGLERDDVKSTHISKIYVCVLEQLMVGDLRDLTFNPLVGPYVAKKLRDIKESRSAWRLNP